MGTRNRRPPAVPAGWTSPGEQLPEFGRAVEWLTPYGRHPVLGRYEADGWYCSVGRIVYVPRAWRYVA